MSRPGLTPPRDFWSLWRPGRPSQDVPLWRIALKPGESRTVSFPIGPEEQGCFGRSMNFAVEPGRFEVMVGTSSERRLTTALVVTDE
jgi:hypothetical protein